jgi:hypothetical protein
MAFAPLGAAAAPPSKGASAPSAPSAPQTYNEAGLEWLIAQATALSSDSTMQQIDNLSRMLQAYRQQRAEMILQRSQLQARRNATTDPATANPLDVAIANLNARIASVDAAIADIEDRLATLYASGDRSHDAALDSQAAAMAAVVSSFEAADVRDGSGKSLTADRKADLAARLARQLAVANELRQALVTAKGAKKKPAPTSVSVK